MRKSETSLPGVGKARFRFLSRTPICQPMIGPVFSKQFCFRVIVTSPENVTCSVSPAPRQSQQIFPPNHVALGYSAITEHWLSRKPCNIHNEIWCTRASGRARDAWVNQAQADWHAFLQYRGVEMQPSAQLVIVGSGADIAGNSGAEGLIDLANTILQEFIKEGIIEPEE